MPRTRSTPAAAFATRPPCRSSSTRHRRPSRPCASRGVEFDLQPDGSLSLGLEGGHSARRIVHAGGAETGRALTSRLARLVAEHELIEVLEGASALALWSDGRRCDGVLTDRGAVRAAATVLATGGGAALWQRTTNPRGAIGAGAVLAHAAGADLADLELCQFHPTALALPGGELDGWLITEAVRGEGALLLDAAGRRFTDELAPRDQVTAAILDRMAADATGAVDLDLRPVPMERFPTITRTLRSVGIDPETEPVPVSPAAHYLIGGVRTDLDGRSSLDGLLAVGEAACTGLHGANRLASNSLSECFVFGTRAARAGLAAGPAGRAASVPETDPEFPAPTTESRAAVWELAGPIRDAEPAGATPRGPLSARQPDCRLGPRPARIARRPPALRLPGRRPVARPPPSRRLGGRHAPARAVAGHERARGRRRPAAGDRSRS